MLGEMLRLVNGQCKNEKFHLMSVLHMSRILNAYQIDLQIHVRKVASYPVLSNIFCSFRLLQHNS